MCGADHTCDVCQIKADPPPVPEAFGLDAVILKSDEQKEVGRRRPGHQRGVSHNRQPDPRLAVKSKQELCGVCLLTCVDLKTIRKVVYEVVSRDRTSDGLNGVSLVLQAVGEAKQDMGQDVDRTEMSAFIGQIVDRVIKTISESTVCYTETITYADCHFCNVRTYPEGTHTIPGTAFGPNIREIFMNMHRMTTAVRSIKYGLDAMVGAIVSTGAISKCLRAMAEYAEHGRIREIPPLPETEEAEVPLTGSAPIVGCGDKRDVPPNHTRTSLDTPPVMTQITDMITMAPCVEFDESASQVEGKRWEAPVAYTRRAALIKIKPSRSKVTIQTEFWWILKRPAGADMYRAGNALKGPFQTCIVHVGRKIEFWAVQAKDGFWEYVLWDMSKKVFRYVTHTPYQ